MAENSIHLEQGLTIPEQPDDQFRRFAGELAGQRGESFTEATRDQGKYSDAPTAVSTSSSGGNGPPPDNPGGFRFIYPQSPEKDLKKFPSGIFWKYLNNHYPFDNHLYTSLDRIFLDRFSQRFFSRD